MRAYSSKDLYNWKDEGLILPPVENDRDSPLHPSRSMDRPHILYNDRTKQYVMWVKIMGKRDAYYYTQYMTIAVADRWLTDLTDKTPDMWDVFEAMFNPEKKPLLTQEQMGALTTQNTSLADYVWLPIRFTEDGRPAIQWLDEWRIEDYE